MRSDRELHRHLHPQARALDDAEPADPRARRARAHEPADSSVPPYAERGGHGLDGVLRRRRRHRRGVHHAAAGGGDRAGTGHRLPVLDQRLGQLDDPRHAAPQLRRQPGADRDHDAGELGAEPVAARGAAARAVDPGRRDDRHDVHGILQRGAREQQRHRLPDARRPAEARFDRGRADRRDPGRTPVRAARLARPRPPGRLRRNRERGAHGARQQQLPRGARHDQGPDGQRRPDGGHQPALGRRFQAPRGQAEGRRDRAPRGRRQRDARRGELQLHDGVRRPQLRLHRHQGGARRQRARSGEARARRVSRHPGADATGRQGRDRLRRHQVHPQLDRRGGQDAVAGARHRQRGDLPLHRQPARRRRAADRDAAVPRRRVLRDVGAGLLDQPVDAAGARAGDRPCRRRRDHRRRERRPAHEEGGEVAARSRAAGGARTRRPDHRDDDRAGRSVRADRLPGRPHRRALHRIRVHAGRARSRSRASSR